MLTNMLADGKADGKRKHAYLRHEVASHGRCQLVLGAVGPYVTQLVEPSVLLEGNRVQAVEVDPLSYTDTSQSLSTTGCQQLSQP